MRTYFCGLDVGGTSTRAVVADEAGESVGWGYAQGANPNHAGWDSAVAHLHEALTSACSQAGCSPAEISSLFLGMASVISASDRALAVAACRGLGLSHTCRISADHDIRIALAGGLSGRPGIALIAGTGSSCYGCNAAGESWQAGGWDLLLDDLGSGYDLARRGMAAACQSADGRLPYCHLRDMFFQELGVTNVVDFAVKVHRPLMSRDAIAAFAPLVLGAAQNGDDVALGIVAHGARELARIVEAVAAKLFPEGPLEIVFIGSLLEKSGFYRSCVHQSILDIVPDFRLAEQELRPAVGALTLAAAQVETEFRPDVLACISSLSAR